MRRVYLRGGPATGCKTEGKQMMHIARKYIAAAFLCMSSAARADLVFECPEHFCNFQLTAELISSEGPTDTYRITTPNRVTNPTLPDEVWAAGGTYELAAGADGFGRALDLYLYSEPPAMWLLWHSYQGDYIIPGSNGSMIGWIDLGTWEIASAPERSVLAVPEPGTLAVIAAALLALSVLRRRRAE